MEKGMINPQNRVEPAICVKNMDQCSPKIFKISISFDKGEKKSNVLSANVIENQGIVGDAHFGTPNPISLLPFESFAELDAGPLEIKPGDFAENITTVGLDYDNISVGTRIALGNQVVIEVIQIGKRCHDGCDIRRIVGDCIMPRKGIFARPINSGRIFEGDSAGIL